jgi:hypothetical protein
MTAVIAAVLSLSPASSRAAEAIEVRAGEIGGTVTSVNGPEAGVWVIAESQDLAPPLIRIVVTDDRGRYLVPSLPDAKYTLRVRGYGLVDSPPVATTPGRTVDLGATVAPNPRAAAEYYPANYWFSLFRAPPSHLFTGGKSGDAVPDDMRTPQEWMGFFKENCFHCHQIGTKYTRTLAPGQGSSVERWAHRIAHGTGPHADPRMNALLEKYRAERMFGNLGRLGTFYTLGLFADWTDRIERGETPPAPPRPQGIERNVVMTLYRWSHDEQGTSLMIHDEISTDKRDPSVNAHGVVYGAVRHHGYYAALDPRTRREWLVPIPGAHPPRKHNPDAGVHNPMLDHKGRLWGTLIGREGPDPAFCTDGTLSRYAAYFPNPSASGRWVSLYDPKNERHDLIPVCYGSHHLNFARDPGHTLYFSGDPDVMGWIDVRKWDETRDAKASQGWCPMVLDTSGDGKIDPDRRRWNEIPNPAASGEETSGRGVATEFRLDPRRDSRIRSFLYGMNVSPADGSAWFNKVQPVAPSGIVRLDRGINPPETCRTEYYEPPRRPDGTYLAFNGRGSDVDSDGVVWTAFTSGQLGAFDRRKCKVLSGPTATGQHCPEGWTIYDAPGPRLQGSDVSADFHYLLWVDLYDVFGLGKDVPIVTGTNSDSLLAFLPKEKRWLTFRVPYPIGFYTRGLDGRVDDPKAGWRGRALWASYDQSQTAHLHVEGGDQKLVEFRLRPNPLAR